MRWNIKTQTPRAGITVDDEVCLERVPFQHIELVDPVCSFYMVSEPTQINVDIAINEDTCVSNGFTTDLLI